MKRIHLALIIIISLLGFFYPKDVGGPLCGPICPGLGLEYYDQPCLGIRARYTAEDWYSDVCYGLPLAEKRCYGVPFTERGLFESREELDCNYPCNDENIRGMCQTQETITFGPITYPCEGLKKQCNW